MLIRTVVIPNIDVKVWKQKHNLPQGKYLNYLMKHEMIRKIPFELTYIEYAQIKY